MSGIPGDIVARTRDPSLFHIATERLLLRPTEVGDAAAIFAAFASDPVATRFLPFETVTDIDRVVKYLERTVRERIQAECVTWVIILRENQRLVGTLDLTIHENISHLGFAIGRAWWGMGIVPEAARAVLDFARSYLGTRRVRGQCDYENRQSVRVFEKLGFEQTGLKEAASKVPSIGPDLRPALLFELKL
jgi:[ribosomal protein S5]-alanine N-acetyltransferase